MAAAVLVLLSCQPVVDPFVPSLVRDDAGGTQQTEVPRRIRLRQIERLFDMTDAQLAVREQRNDAQAHVIAERLEHA